jgi:hypothetical protein
LPTANMNSVLPPDHSDWRERRIGSRFQVMEQVVATVGSEVGNDWVLPSLTKVLYAYEQPMLLPQLKQR